MKYSMNKGGLGVGSASMVLVFAVLSLTIFSLIAFVTARNDKALVRAQSQLVTSYYAADSAAERVLAEILDMETIPETVAGVDVRRGWNEESRQETIYFFLPISDIKALYVNVIIEDDAFRIMSWRMYSTDDWILDDRLPVWDGG